MLMVEAARFHGAQTPGTKYNPNFNFIRPKSAATTMIPNQRISGQVMKDSRLKSIKKDKSKPCVGSYDITKSHRLTEPKNRAISFSQLKKTSFFEKYVKDKTIVPAMGKYVGADRGFKLTSTPLKSLARKRT